MTNEVTERKEKMKMIDCNVHGLILEITKTAFSLGRVKMESVLIFFFSVDPSETGACVFPRLAGGQTLGGSES